MTIQEALDRLKTAEKWDNESVHGRYDDLMCAIAETCQPELKKEADEIVKGINFWYA